MKRANSILAAGAAIAGFLAATASACAQEGPVIAIPGHPDVPVIINGRNASYTVVVGDWGLARPGAVSVRIYGPPAYPLPDTIEYPGYFPSNDHPPRSGRQEIEPRPRTGPRPGRSYHRSWTSESSHEPATVYPQFPAPQVSITPSEQPQTNPTNQRRTRR